MILYVIQGIGYGFAGAVQPGPFQTYIISQTLRIGWRRTLPASLAPLISDGPIILLVLLVLSQVPSSLQRVLHIASGLFIGYLALGAFGRWRHTDPASAAPVASGHQTVLKAVIMNLISPGPYIYWSLVAGPTLLAGLRNSPGSGIGFLVGFYFSVVATFAFIIVIFGTASQIGPKVNRALLGISAVALACFGLYQMYLGILP